MDVNIQLHTKEAFQRLFTKDVLNYANSRLQAYCDPFVPFRDGDLARSATADETGVTYNVSYARYMYYGEKYLAKNGSSWAKKGEKKYPSGQNLEYDQSKHNVATSYWDKAMARSKGQQLADDIQEYIERK